MPIDTIPIVQKFADLLAERADAERAFVEDNRDRFSGLTAREATKHLKALPTDVVLVQHRVCHPASGFFCLSAQF